MSCTLSQGKVCICDLCEMQRTLLKLSSSSTSSVSSSSAPSSLRKRKQIGDDNDNGTDIDNDESSTAPDQADANTQKNARIDHLNNQTIPSPTLNDIPICLPITTTTDDDDAERLSKMTSACRTILRCIGENPNREGLQKTPDRWAKALLFFTHGYQQSTASVTNDALFTTPPPPFPPPPLHPDGDGEMVVVKDIDIHSLCEHHMVPFTGRVHIGYVPGGKIIGLSKLARIAEVFGRRLQVQERLTAQIADAVVEAVQPRGVAVMVECRHFCMVMRGVEKCAASTVSTTYRGSFKGSAAARSEFMNLVGRR